MVLNTLLNEINSIQGIGGIAQSKTKKPSITVVAEYLRLAVGEDYLVVDRHRFPLGQRLHQQLLLDLREAIKVSAD